MTLKKFEIENLFELRGKLEKKVNSIISFIGFIVFLTICEIWTKLQSAIIFVTHDLPEAVYLGDDIYMRACPGKIVEKICTGLPLERDRTIKRTSKFIELVNLIETKMISIQHSINEEKTKTWKN